MFAFKLLNQSAVDHDTWHLDEGEIYPRSMFSEFKLQYSSDFPLGCRVVCRECGMPAFVSVTWFPCLNRFVVTKCVCRFGCNHHRWVLRIVPGELFKTREADYELRGIQV